jgi:hypothetical protein
MTKHNKKRNVGVIHEQLVRYVGSAIISGNDKLAEKAISIITNHFKAGSELYREFRLFNALVNVPMEDVNLSRLVIDEAKNAAKTHNKEKLSNEKSNLIKSINHVLSEEKFYDIRVPNYKLYASVQSLLDTWRGGRILEINEIARFESNLLEWISRKSIEKLDEGQKHDPLVYKIMLKKFQEKYGKSLLSSQKQIVQSSLTKESRMLVKELEAARKESLESLLEFKKSCNNDTLLEKIDKVIKNIEDFKTTNESADLSKTLQLLELVSELKGKDDE